MRRHVKTVRWLNQDNGKGGAEGGTEIVIESDTYLLTMVCSISKALRKNATQRVLRTRHS